VIDWGDVCVADPAIDLQLVWSFLPPEHRTAFLDAYGPVTEAQLVRARVLAFSLSAALAAYGHTEGRSSVEREAIAGLVRAALD
jgi:aminoglycoside phosphotransferase (APT) family kinase protein